MRLSAGTLSPSDIMLRPQIHQQASYAADLISDAAGQKQLVRVSQHDGVPCPHCGLYFQGETAVKVQQNNDPLPLSQRHELVKTWVDGGALQLLRGMTDNLRTELLQRCCICRQWIASSSHIKSHLRRSHSTLFGPCMEELEEHCGLLTSVLHDPCPYCQHPLTSKNKSRHASRCPVLLQAAFCCQQYGHGTGQCRTHLTLRGLAPGLPSSAHDQPAADPGTSKRSKRSGTSGSDTGRGSGQPSAQMVKTERQRGTQGASWHGWSDHQQQQATQHDTLQMLIQLSLRQEDAINVLRMDRSFLLLFKTQGPETMLPTMFEIATRWKQKREQQQADSPLRIALLKCMLLELRTRMAKPSRSTAWSSWGG